MNNQPNSFMSDEYHEKRLRMADIAECEAKRGYRGNSSKCGPEIEKYLGDFRKLFTTLYPNEGSWNDLNRGFDWCCAFVCWCCGQAGFNLPLNPMNNWSLAAVPVWYEWAKLEENRFYFKVSEDKFSPMRGDIVLFNNVFVGKDLDHIGIVLEIKDDYIITAEGNINNSTGLVKRNLDNHINGFIRLNNY